MKKNCFLVIFFSLFLAMPVLAISGACSSHGGVNCSYGSDFDGSVVCNDGWSNSYVSFYNTDECQSKFLDELSWKCPYPVNTCYSPLTSSYKCSSQTDLDRIAGVTGLSQGFNPSSAEMALYNECKTEIDRYNNDLLKYNQCGNEYQQKITNRQSCVDNLFNEKQRIAKYLYDIYLKELECNSYGNAYINTDNKCVCNNGYVLSNSRCIAIPKPEPEILKVEIMPSPPVIIEEKKIEIDKPIIQEKPKVVKVIIKQEAPKIEKQNILEVTTTKEYIATSTENVATSTVDLKNNLPPYISQKLYKQESMGNKMAQGIKNIFVRIFKKLIFWK